MNWTSPDSALSRLLSGDPWAILIAFVVALSLPIVLHSFLYRASSRHTATPAFLLLGISGAGKTSLLTLVRAPLLFAPIYTLADLTTVAPTSLRPTVHLYRLAIPDPHLPDSPNRRPSPALVHSSRLEPLPLAK
jgi:signal recognition particle receptor subunit beta